MKPIVRCKRCGCLVKRGHSVEGGKLCNECYKEICDMNKHFEEVKTP